jgi:hypothetical protein
LLSRDSGMGMGGLNPPENTHSEIRAGPPPDGSRVRASGFPSYAPLTREEGSAPGGVRVTITT